MLRHLLPFGLCLGAAAPVAAQAESYLALFGEAGSRRPAWRMGWNSDGLCYPDMGNCPGNRPGYAWLSEIEGGGQSGFGIAWGTSLGRGPRLEISLDRTQTTGIVGGDSLGVFYLSESGRPFPDASAVGLFGSASDAELIGELVATTPNPAYTGASFTGGFTGLSATTVTVNFLYDLSPVRGLTPYFGLGVGYSRVAARVPFTASYSGYPELETASEGGFSGGSLATRLVVGVHRRVLGRFGVGLEAVSTRAGEITGLTAYELHPSQTEASQAIRDLRRLALRLVLRTYL